MTQLALETIRCRVCGGLVILEEPTGQVGPRDTCGSCLPVKSAAPGPPGHAPGAAEPNLVPGRMLRDDEPIPF